MAGTRFYAVFHLFSRVFDIEEDEGESAQACSMMLVPARPFLSDSLSIAFAKALALGSENNMPA